jgi:putative endonuclease
MLPKRFLTGRRLGMSKSTTVGRLVEEAACRHLESLGYRIVARNYRCRVGEIDIVARHGIFLVFIEVRYRGKGSVELPAESLGPKKLRRLRRAALHYLAGLRTEPPAVRVDVCLARPFAGCIAEGAGGAGGSDVVLPVPGLGFVSLEIQRGVVDFG